MDSDEEGGISHNNIIEEDESNIDDEAEEIKLRENAKVVAIHQ